MAPFLIVLGLLALGVGIVAWATRPPYPDPPPRRVPDRARPDASQPDAPVSGAATTTGRKTPATVPATPLQGQPAPRPNDPFAHAPLPHELDNPA